LMKMTRNMEEKKNGLCVKNRVLDLPSISIVDSVDRVYDFCGCWVYRFNEWAV
jgi:hypothetical protein